MAAKVETTVREWSTPVKKIVEGTPPKPVSLHFHQTLVIWQIVANFLFVLPVQ